MNNPRVRGFPHTKDPGDPIAHLAARQFGVVSRDQAVAGGLTTRAIESRLESQRWKRRFPGVYIVSGVPDSWQQRLKAAELWAGALAVVSHRAAAGVWRLDGIDPGGIELMTTGSRSQVPSGIILHRTKALARRDWAEYGGFRVTGLARTLVDLAGVVDPATFEAVAESAIRKNAGIYGDLAARLDGLGSRGRNGIAALRTFLAARDPTAAATESVLETRFLRLLRAAGLPEPVRQYVVWDGHRYIIRLDFAYVEIRFGIRLNGAGTHLQKVQWQKDQTQGNDLTLLLWSILDFTWDDVCDRPEETIARVRQGYEMATSTSMTSPPGSRQSAL